MLLFYLFSLFGRLQYPGTRGRDVYDNLEGIIRGCIPRVTTDIRRRYSSVAVALAGVGGSIGAAGRIAAPRLPRGVRFRCAA